MSSPTSSNLIGCQRSRGPSVYGRRDVSTAERVGQASVVYSWQLVNALVEATTRQRRCILPSSRTPREARQSLALLFGCNSMVKLVNPFHFRLSVWGHGRLSSNILCCINATLDPLGTAQCNAGAFDACYLHQKDEMLIQEAVFIKDKHDMWLARQ